jgi:hypothetical protein
MKVMIQVHCRLTLLLRSYFLSSLEVAVSSELRRMVEMTLMAELEAVLANAHFLIGRSFQQFPKISVY